MFKSKLLTCSLATTILLGTVLPTAFAAEVDEKQSSEDSGEVKKTPVIKVLDSNVRINRVLKEFDLQHEYTTFQDKTFQEKLDFLNSVFEQKANNLRADRQEIALYQQTSTISSKLIHFEKELDDSELINSMVEDTFQPEYITSRDMEGAIRQTLSRMLSYNKTLQIYQKELLDVSTKLGKEHYARFQVIDNNLSNIMNDYDDWRKDELNSLNKLMNGNPEIEKELDKYVIDKKDGLNFFVDNELITVKKTELGEKWIPQGTVAHMLDLKVTENQGSTKFAYQYKSKTLLQKQDGVYLDGEQIYMKQLGKYVGDEYYVDFEVLLNLLGFSFEKKGNTYKISNPKETEHVLNTLTVDEAVALLMAHL